MARIISLIYHICLDYTVLHKFNCRWSSSNCTHRHILNHLCNFRINQRTICLKRQMMLSSYGRISKLTNRQDTSCWKNHIFLRCTLQHTLRFPRRSDITRRTPICFQDLAYMGRCNSEHTACQQRGSHTNQDTFSAHKHLWSSYISRIYQDIWNPS